MKRLGLMAALCLIAVPAQAMDVATFLTKAHALKSKGMMAMFSPDLKLLQAEMKTASDNYRASLDADAKAGRKPGSCPPPRGTVRLKADELLAEFDAIPPGQRTMSVSAAMTRMMEKRFPCKV